MVNRGDRKTCLAKQDTNRARGGDRQPSHAGNVSGREKLKTGEGPVGTDEVCTHRLEFIESLPAFLGIQSLDCIANNADATPAFHQAFGSETHAVLRHHAEDGNFRSARKSLHQGLRVAALEDVERLLLKQDLLKQREVIGQARRLAVGHNGDFVSESLGYILRAVGSLDAVRRELCELRVVNGMKAAMRNQEDLTVTRNISKTTDVGQKALGPGNVKLSVGQHEVGLSVHFPEDDVVSQSVCPGEFSGSSLSGSHPNFKGGGSRVRGFGTGRKLTWKTFGEK